VKILVTGGAGFIGSEFVRQAVSRGDQVVLVDVLTYAGDLVRIETVKSSIKFYQADVQDRAALEDIFKKEKPEYVVHWAAESHVDRSIMDATPFIDTNVRGTQTLLDVAKQFGVEKFVNIATDEVYGALGEDGQFFEDTHFDPNSPYAVSKASADMLGRSYFKTFGMPVVTVRPSNNYGPWQYPEKLVPVVILKALNNEEVPVYGQGLNVREWLFVSDCVKGVYEILKKGKPGEAYNIGSGEELRNIEVVKAILNIVGKPESLITFVKDRLGHDFRYSLNFDKSEKELNWKADVMFEEGMERTVKWYLDNVKWMEEKLEYLRKYWKKAY
jgi:dTDP-glucose 4,6-dehydratase